MTSTSPPGSHDDALGELGELVADLRHSLIRHARAGRWAASAAATPGQAHEAHPAHEVNSPLGDERGHPAGPPGPTSISTSASASIPESRSLPNEGRAGGEGPEDEAEVRRERRTLATVRAELGDCQRCKLAQSRTKLVFGAGAEDAALVFVGEAPGADEDRTGEPFVGRAGELLDKMIEAMGWSRGSVYIANLLKCRPPNNRNPEPDEARECRPFLIAQLEAVAPRIVVALGRPAANALLGVDAPIGALRGQFHERLGVKIMPTFHPAYLLREPARKRDVWDDLKLVMAELERIGVTAHR